MTTETKKPSDRVLSRIDLGNGMKRLELNPIALADYLDEEAERRERFEAQLQERIARLEARAPAGTVLIETAEQWRACFDTEREPPPGMLPVLGFVAGQAPGARARCLSADEQAYVEANPDKPFPESLR